MTFEPRFRADATVHRVRARNVHLDFRKTINLARARNFEANSEDVIRRKSNFGVVDAALKISTNAILVLFARFRFKHRRIEYTYIVFSKNLRNFGPNPNAETPSVTFTRIRRDNKD